MNANAINDGVHEVAGVYNAHLHTSLQKTRVW